MNEAALSTHAQPNLIIIGAGGHGRVCADVARRAGYRVLAFCDPAFRHGDEILGVPVHSRGERELFDDWPAETDLFVAIGDNSRRLAVVSQAVQAAVPLAVLMDPMSSVSPSASLSDGVIVMPGAVVNSEALVGRAAIVNTGAIVEHGARVGQGAHVAPGACMTGDSAVGARTLVGARATLLPGVQIGDDVIVGGGAVVTRDAGDKARLAGVPARPVRDFRMVAPAGAS